MQCPTLEGAKSSLMPDSLASSPSAWLLKTSTDVGGAISILEAWMKKKQWLVTGLAYIQYTKFTLTSNTWYFTTEFKCQNLCSQRFTPAGLIPTKLKVFFSFKVGMSCIKHLKCKVW